MADAIARTPHLTITEDSMPDGSNTAAYPYVTHLDVKFDALERIDVPALVAACADRW